MLNTNLNTYRRGSGTDIYLKSPKTSKWKTVALILFFGILLGLIPLLGYSQNWNLVWQDEFNNGISPDWVFETGRGASGWGNNELQYYRRENATVENGKLVITAKRENFGGASYTSARMKTQGRKTFRYGKIEARIALPQGQGLWPAFWMLGSNISEVSWPACGEIDVMEHINNEPVAHGTMHWQDQNGSYAQYGSSTSVNVSSYHVYTVEWDQNNIRWFVDGNQYHVADISNDINGTSEFHNDFFLLLNMAVGGNWPGFSVDHSKLPARMYVDYVRVYQKTTTPPAHVKLFQHCDYGGYSVSLNEGRYTLGQLSALGAANDDISSLQVQNGYQVTIYEHDNFRGSSLTKTSNDPCLVNEGFNDKASSVVVAKANGGGPGQLIEAENFSSMNGVQVEPCSEGGQNVGYIDTGDWMAYSNITFPTSGNYRIEYRVASTINGARLSADLNAGSTILGQVNIPNTGGWQNWTTVSHTVYVNAGTYPFGIYAATGGWNINWITITKLNNGRSFNTTILDEVTEGHTATVYPNPFTNTLQFQFVGKTAHVTITDALGHEIIAPRIVKSGASLDLSGLKNGLYLLTIDSNGTKETKRLIKN